MAFTLGHELLLAFSVWKSGLPGYPPILRPQEGPFHKCLMVEQQCLRWYQGEDDL